MTMTMPQKPTRIAIHRRRPTCSPSSGIDRIVTKIGIANMIVAVIVSGR